MDQAAVPSAVHLANPQLAKVAKRVARELCDFHLLGIRGCSVEADPTDAFAWHVSLQARPGTSRDGETLRLLVHFSKDYPFKPPEFKFEDDLPLPAHFLEVLKKRWNGAHFCGHFFPQLARAVGCSVCNKLESMRKIGSFPPTHTLIINVACAGGSSLMQFFPAQHHHLLSGELPTTVLLVDPFMFNDSKTIEADGDEVTWRYRNVTFIAADIVYHLHEDLQTFLEMWKAQNIVQSYVTRLSRTDHP